MHDRIFASVLLALIPLLVSSSPVWTTTSSTTPQLPFNFTYLFTATLNLGPPPPSAKTDPITIDGSSPANGVIIPEPILNGTVTGSAINGSITSGLAFPSLLMNGTIETPLIEVYGVTDDGAALYIHATGIGAPTGQVTRIVSPHLLPGVLLYSSWFWICGLMYFLQELSIGGGSKYNILRNAYILTAVTPSADRTSVTAVGYAVQNVYTK
jgi:hypothetical protein